MAEPIVRFDARAAQDVRAAVEWYVGQRADLGGEFLDELDVCVERFAAHPELHPTVGVVDARRALLDRFPFAIYYRMEGVDIVVLGVIHASRDPAFWRSRLEE